MKGIIVGWLFTGLVAFGLFLIPGVDFVGRILGGTIQNVDVFIASMPGPFGALGYLIVTLVELLLFNTYPLSWVLTWRPWDALTILLMIVPWICGGLITAALVSNGPKDSLFIGIGLIICNILWCLLFFVVLPGVIINMVAGGMDTTVMALLEGLASGLTDMPPGVSAILVQLQGGGLFTGAAIMIGMTKREE